MMRTVLGVLLILFLACGAGNSPTEDRQTVIVVVGAGGDTSYAAMFRGWAKVLRSALADSEIEYVEIGVSSDEASVKTRLEKAIRAATRASTEPLWIFLLGHGTFDGVHCKFNLRGPDMSAVELSRWLENCERPLALINCTSSSAPFIDRLAGLDRVIVTATQSGYEFNFSRYGGHFIDALISLKSDLDKDGQVSLLEAFVCGSARVAEYYSNENRLATEHALIDDNGDGKGTPAAWFRGLRTVQRARGAVHVDGMRAGQFHLLRSASDLELNGTRRARRDELERKVLGLREAREELGDARYYDLIEVPLLELARLYEEIDLHK